MSNRPKLEVTFIRPQGEMMIRMVSNDVRSVVEAAKVLKATHVVLQDDFAVRDQLPIWSVFDVRHVEKIRSEPVLPLALKSFVAEKNDAAVMWAMHQRGG